MLVNEDNDANVGEIRQKNSTNPLQNATLEIPMLFGRNVIPKFNGKKANWPRFIPTFNAVVDNKYPHLPDVNINLKTGSVDLLSLSNSSASTRSPW